MNTYYFDNGATTKVKQEVIEEDIEQIKTGNYISKIDKYFDCFYEKQETIIDYINDEYCIFLDEIGKIIGGWIKSCLRE